MSNSSPPRTSSKLKLRFAEDVMEPIQTYCLMNQDGTLRDSNASIFRELDPEDWRALYSKMVQLKEFDEVMQASQRQGRISFYLTATGEEAIHVGSASALDDEDTVFAQYREQGVLLWRGATVQMLADQCMSNAADPGKGRQMPVHYQSKELHFQTISSPLATQLPHAVGAAYAHKLDGRGKIVVCYFGEGAASEGDFHAALNLASTTDSPVLFFCRNNGYAISTPAREQYRGDGIASRAVGYGMPAIRVDGSDVAAVRAATALARRICVEQSRPVLVEAMAYRVGHHSTSDDSSRYRSPEEMAAAAAAGDPLVRLRAFLEAQGWWGAAEDRALRATERKAVLEALRVAEQRPKPSPLEDLFTDVYGVREGGGGGGAGGLPPHLEAQRAELAAHLALYPETEGY